MIASCFGPAYQSAVASIASSGIFFKPRHEHLAAKHCCREAGTGGRTAMRLMPGLGLSYSAASSA